MDGNLTPDEYLKMRDECCGRLLASTVEGVTELTEYEIEKRCDEAVGKHKTIGEIDEPRANAAVVALAVRTHDALEDLPPDTTYESAGEYLADLAHRATKYDLIAEILDERAEANR
jgi:(p)ppGpp synthase/HD superfamily hydrolase